MHVCFGAGGRKTTMQRRTQTKQVGKDRDDRKASIEILDVLLQLEATNHQDAVTVERLQLEGVGRSRLQPALDWLVEAGFACRVEYRPSRSDGVKLDCHPTTDTRECIPRYCLSSGFTLEQFDL